MLTPTLAKLPVRHGELQPRGLEAILQNFAALTGTGKLLRFGPLLEQAAERAFTFMPFTPVWNITGQPAASLPLHWTADGLPVGVQLVGRFGEEGTLFALSSQLEATWPWTNRVPDKFAASGKPGAVHSACACKAAGREQGP